MLAGPGLAESDRPTSVRYRMQDLMAAFFQSQLDFILFFYGLAFMLLGTVCFSVGKAHGGGRAWMALGLFGFVHGASEWLDLTALVIGDAPAFGLARLAVMTASFVLLMEAARLQAVQFGLKTPGRWIYAPLLLLVVVGAVVGGANTANALSRYAIGLVGALGVCLAFAGHARRLSGVPRYLAISAAVGFLLYGVAAGLIVRAAPFWPASLINQDAFIQATGAPIQLVRGLLACWLAFSTWAIAGRLLMTEVASDRYTAHLRRQFFGTVTAMLAILVLGWMLTEFLGGIYQRNVEGEARGDINVLFSRMAGETEMADNLVTVMAGMPSTRSLLTHDGRGDPQEARAALDLHVAASGAAQGYLLDRSGAVVARSSGQPERAASAIAARILPTALRTALAGGAGHQFAFGPDQAAPDYYASYPVRAPGGAVVGVAVLEKSLDHLATDLERFDQPYYFIDPDGVVALTNRPETRLRTLWPPADKAHSLVHPVGTPSARPMLDKAAVDGTWDVVGGARAYVSRRYAEHTPWSLVMVTPNEGLFANRVLGIIITLLVAVMTLIYLFGRDRSLRDSIHMERRLELQALARDLRFKATTDGLTGLHNRSKFDEALAGEILRSERYATPFALLLYDVDHFKAVNDTYGHQIGDRVLIQLSQLVAERIRATDLLARWGGEEFMVLAPGADGAMAAHLADQLRRAIGQMEFDGVGKVTCSFGVAQYVAGDTVESLIGRADVALYRAKLGGRDRVELAEPPSEAAEGLASVA
jgi:diguanylate cyclase (GGDEF)-like protein